MSAPVKIWVTTRALEPHHGVVQVLCEPHPRIPGWMCGVGGAPVQRLYAIHPDDWHYTEAEALARVKQLLTRKRRRLQREHLREMARLATICEGLKAGLLPMAKEKE